MKRKVIEILSGITWIICICYFLVSCKHGSNDDSMEIKSINTPGTSETILKQNILEKGDVKSYEELSTAYLDRSEGEFMIWALIMANKYDYPQAYFDVFVQLSELSGEAWSLDQLDEKTRTIAIEYLTKAAEKGHHQAPEVLGQYYMEGKYVNKDAELGNKWKAQAKKKMP